MAESARFVMANISEHCTSKNDPRQTFAVYALNVRGIRIYPCISAYIYSCFLPFVDWHQGKSDRQGLRYLYLESDRNSQYVWAGVVRSA